MKNKLLLFFLLIALALGVAGFYHSIDITFDLWAFTSIVVIMLLFMATTIIFTFTTIMLERYEDKTKPLLTVFLIAFAIELITAPLRGILFMLCAVVSFILFFIFMIIILKKYEDKIKRIYILFVVLAGCSVLTLPMRIIDWKDTLISLPDYLFHIFGILMGYWFYISKKWLKYIVVIFSVISCVFLYFWGYEMFINKYILNQTFTGAVEPKCVDNIFFQTNEGDTVSLENFKGKYLLVDCWHTHCSICFREFPKFQALAEEYKENQNIEFIALNCRFENEGETFATGDSIFIKREMPYPCFSIDFKDESLKTFVHSYPTVLIFDKESRLIFIGDIKFAKRYLKQILK